MITNDKITLVPGGWRDSSDYALVLQLLQRAEWSEAAGLLMYLLQDYPGEPELESLLADTQLRLEMEQTAAAQQKGRRRRLPSGRVLFVPLLVLVMAGLVCLAVVLYNGVITPSIRQQQNAAQQKAIFDGAQQALSVGDFDRALTIYDQLARLNPGYPKMAEGRAQAEQARKLDDAYQLANEQLAAGALADAQATLVGIQQISPNYRDANVLLSRIERQQRLTGVVGRAAVAIEARNWEEVVARLEEARTLTPPQDRGPLDADLYDAYLNLAGQLIAGSQGRPQDIQRAIDLYGRALAIRPGQPAASEQKTYAESYLAGYNAVKAGNWDRAVEMLEPLYLARPDYVDGEVVKLLYNAYMRSGDSYYSANQPQLAWERYTRASKLQGVDTQTARALAANLVAYVTPTPLPMVAATPTPRPGQAARLPTVEPAQVPAARQIGKILFISTRSGAPAYWVMDPDGKNQIMLKDQVTAKADYERLRDAESRAPDGKKAAYVATQENTTSPQVFVANPDNTATRLTDLAGLNADPVWSPKGYWIAFVSNQPGNDEIFLVGADGQGTKRLTQNTFEWDKHPSWSSDGARLVFWSNRSGKPQIWVMNQDGSDQRNISSNDSEDRDPIWVK